MATTAPPSAPTAPTVPVRSDRSGFPIQMYNFFLYMVGSFTTWLTNSLTNVYDNANDAYASANASAASASAASTSAGTAASTANFHGSWSALTGAATVPYSVAHLGKVWMLLSNIADITTKVPGTAVEWQAVTPTNFVIKNANYTAVDGDQLAVDTSAGAVTITLPATPVAGKTRVDFRDYSNTFATNNMTVGRNGNKIEGLSEDMIVDINDDSFGLVYIDATKGWINL